MWRRLNKGYPLQLELISLALLFVAFYLAIAAYSTLPDEIPTHFGASGQPDGWGGRPSIFVFPGVSAGVYLLITGITVAFSLVKDPRSLINLPVDKKAAITVERADAIRVVMARSLFVLKCLMQGMAVYGTYATIQVATGKTATLGNAFWLFLAGILVVVAYMIVVSVRLMTSPGKP